MKKILVSGGCGYIGSHTVVELIENSYQPIIIDNYANSEKGVLQSLQDLCGQEIIHYEGDCRDAALLDTIFSENEIDGVIHFAAYKAVGESVAKPLMYFDNNLNSLLEVLRAMRKHKVNKLVFTGSTDKSSSLKFVLQSLWPR